jgi:hypothetical protein
MNSIERIDLGTDTAANTLTLKANDVNDMAGFNTIRTGSASADGNTWSNVTGSALSTTTKFHQMVVDGGGNDVVDLKTGGTWAVAGTVSDGSNAYTVYQNASTLSQLIVKSGVTVNMNVAPVILDVNRDGELNYGQVTMDVNGDGALDMTKWAGAQDGVLVWDKYADGLVHDNSQYAFAQYATTYRLDAQGLVRAATDLEGLADAFDSNQDAVFNAADAKFAEFKVWQDANQNGVSDDGEVRSLLDWGITEINLTSDGVVRTPASGVTEAGRTTATATDGSSVLVADVAFDFQGVTAEWMAAQAATAAVPELLLSLGDVLSDTVLDVGGGVGLDELLSGVGSGWGGDGGVGDVGADSVQTSPLPSSYSSLYALEQRLVLDLHLQIPVL